jgi:hypothetical protein
MNAKQPPRLGTLLLERLGPQNEALAGDLAEEYRSGRSPVWYWWQVLTSIVIGAGRELWSHKWLGIQVPATLIGIQTFLGYGWSVLWYRTTLSARVQEFTESMWGQPDPVVNAPYQWILTVALIPLPIVAGWVLAKSHPAQRGAAAIICCVVVTAMGIPRLMQLTTIPMDESVRFTYLSIHMARVVSLNVGLLLGAFAAGSKPRPSTVVE